MLQVEDEIYANTLSGLLMERSTRMPEVGDKINEGEFTLEIISMKSHRVDSVSIIKSVEEKLIETKENQE